MCCAPRMSQVLFDFARSRVNCCCTVRSPSLQKSEGTIVVISVANTQRAVGMWRRNGCRTDGSSQLSRGSWPFLGVLFSGFFFKTDVPRESVPVVIMISTLSWRVRSRHFVTFRRKRSSFGNLKTFGYMVSNQTSKCSCYMLSRSCSVYYELVTPHTWVLGEWTSLAYWSVLWLLGATPKEIYTPLLDSGKSPHKPPTQVKAMELFLSKIVRK